jgi:MoaA/NifB/PqqE/SkfB family radical SAM enzyme
MKSYWRLKLKMGLRLLASRKITARKLFNLARCIYAHLRRRQVTGAYPAIIFFEPTNRCNLWCRACRASQTEPFNQSPQNQGSFIPVGSMPAEMFKEIIDQVKSHLCLATLYVNGEPLLRKDLAELIGYANQRHVGTMISTNGNLLTEEASAQLLDAGLDMIKFALSGFSQKVYEHQHRGGDIERVKANLRSLVRIHRERRSSALIMVDYIIFEHNQHEAALWQELCEQLGVMFNIRQGISGGHDGLEELYGGFSPAETLCDWPWKTLTVNWDGSIFPCCEYAMWLEAKEVVHYQVGVTNIKEIWNGDRFQALRRVHLDKGRQAIPTCAVCHNQGLRPQA